jgi:anaerobic selenocysteine-containing dehydrogenase
MIFNEIDPLTGATRDAVYIDARDAAMLKVVEGDRVLLRSDVGSMNARVKIVALPSLSIQVHWPEGNVLIDAGINEDASRIPDYNAVVTIEKINKG